jgi:hypothetical protein
MYEVVDISSMKEYDLTNYMNLSIKLDVAIIEGNTILMDSVISIQDMKDRLTSLKRDAEIKIKENPLYKNDVERKKALDDYIKTDEEYVNLNEEIRILERENSRVEIILSSNRRRWELVMNIINVMRDHLLIK